MGIFPSASLAWVLKEESFLKDVDVVSNLKIRTGYGLTGNQDAISAYNSLKLMSPTNCNYSKWQACCYIRNQS